MAAVSPPNQSYDLPGFIRFFSQAYVPQANGNACIEVMELSVIVVVSVVILPLLLLSVQGMSKGMRLVTDAFAVLCAIVAGAIVAMAVYEVRRDGTVFMTNFHKIFNNDLFLIASGYLGIYGIALLVGCAFRRYREL